MTLTEACNVLRVDEGPNDELIQGLIDSLPGFIELSTGMTPEQQETEPLVKTVAGFLLRLWYYADNVDDVKLSRTIRNLLKCITLKVKKPDENGAEQD